MYNELILNSMYCNVSCVPFVGTIIVFVNGPTCCVHAVMLYVILILRSWTNWRQGRLTLLAKKGLSYLHYKLIIVHLMNINEPPHASTSSGGTGL